MNKRNVIYLGLSALCCLLLLSSCLGNKRDAPNTFYPNGIVTVKVKEVKEGEKASKVAYLQLDAQTTLYPLQQQELLKGWKEEYRALVNFTEVPGQPTQGCTKAVKLNWLRSFAFTKETLPAGDNPEQYGKDIVMLDPQNCFVEDGYLNLLVRIFVGSTEKKHTLNLLREVNSKNPYEVELRHDAKGDMPRWAADNWIAFRLDKLPKPTDKSQKLIIRYRSSNNEERRLEVPLFPTQKSEKK